MESFSKRTLSPCESGVGRRLLLLGDQGVVNRPRTRRRRPRADARPIALEGRTLLERAEHQAKADLRAQIDVGGGQGIACEILAFRPRPPHPVQHLLTPPLPHPPPTPHPTPQPQ